MTISSLKISQPQIPSSSTQREALFEQVSHEIRTQPFFKELSTDIGYLLDFARQLRAFQHVLVFGMGGATLSGQLFTHFSRSSGPSLHFVDNIDSYEWNSLLSSVNPQHTGTDMKTLDKNLVKSAASGR